MMHFHGKDKFKITLNSHCGCSKLLVNSELYLNFNISGNVGLDKNSNALNVLLKNSCEEKVNIRSYYPDNELKMKRNIDQCVGDAEEFNLMRIKSERAFSGSPSRKRLPSPRYISPGKRKRAFPVQSNKIDNYFIKKDVSDTEDFSDCSKEYKIDSHSNVCCAQCRNAGCVHCSESNSKKSGSREMYPKPHSPELIVLSSDEDDDSKPSPKPKTSHVLEESKTSHEILFSQIKPSKSLPQENCTQNGLRNLHYLNRKGVILKKEFIVQHSSPVIVLSSDEDENEVEDLSPTSKIIDLTCDDDYVGDVLVYEHSLLENRIQSASGKREFKSSLSDSSENSSLSVTKLAMGSSKNQFEERNKILVSHNVKQSYLANPIKTNTEFSSSELSVRSESNLENNSSKNASCLKVCGNLSDSDLPRPPCVESPIDIIDVENWKHDSPELIQISENGSLYSPSQNKNIDENIISISSDQGDEIKVCEVLDENLNSNCFPPTKVSEEVCEKSINSEPTHQGDINIVASDALNNFNEVESDLENNGLRQVSSASESASETSEMTNDSTSFGMCQQQTPGESCGRVVHSKSKVVSAEELCRTQAHVYYSKLNKPWIEMGALYTPQCIINGPADCNLAHGKKNVSLEQDHYDENFLLEAVCPSSAIELLQRRIGFRMYPSSSLVQYAIFCVMERWNEIGIDALLCLHQLLETHPPCAYGMLDYYKKIFFSSINNIQIQALDGVFWYCLTKIEHAFNFEKYQPQDNPGSPSQSPVREDSLENTIFPTINHTNRGFGRTCRTVKLEQLFNCLDYFIDVMEADLDVGLLKNMSNPKRYICKNSKPLVAVAFWSNQMIGSVSDRCKQLLELYVCSIKHSSSKIFSLSLNRLLAMMAAVIYASERNPQPPKYPNVGDNCKKIASHFSSILLQSDLNMIEVSSMLNFLKPDWFRWLVCCSLIEKLYGRSMDVSLQPAIKLIKNLWDVKQEFPDYELQSTLILSETGSEPVVNGNCLEISPSLLKNATKKDKKGETRLHVTCRLNRFNEVKELLSVPNINVSEKDNDGWTPLHEAALHGSIECIQLLLNHRTPSGGPSIDLRVKNSCGITPLMDAVKRNHLNVAKLLIEYGGRELLLDTDENGYSVLDLVCSEEMKDILNNAPNNSKWNVLSTIPVTLRLKLVILIPQIILFYMKFSEVKKVASYLMKRNVEPLRSGIVAYKFEPLTCKQDYKDLKELQSLVKKMLISNFGLVDRLIFIL